MRTFGVRPVGQRPTPYATALRALRIRTRIGKEQNPTRRVLHGTRREERSVRQARTGRLYRRAGAGLWRTSGTHLARAALA